MVVDMNTTYRPELIRKRAEGFKRAFDAAIKATTEVNALRLDRKDRRARLDEIAKILEAEQDKVNAAYPL